MSLQVGTYLHACLDDITLPFPNLNFIINSCSLKSMALNRTFYITACMAIALAMLTSNLKQAVASTLLWVSGLWRSSPTTMAIKLEEATIAQLLAGLEQGHFTVTELVEVTCHRFP